MINTARKLKYLPLDDEDKEDRSSSEGLEESDQSGSEGERECARAQRMKQKSSAKGPLNQDSFSCLNGGTGITLESNPNRRTIEILQQMADYYNRTRDIWRVRAYRMAIGTFKKQDTKIATYEEAKTLPAIGHRLAEKIQEIVPTDRLRRLENALLEPNDKVLALFLGIYGVGTSQAQKWVQAGHKTLNDLKVNASLTANQRIGIAHYNDFITRIPREEVTALGGIVKETSADIDVSVQVIIAGSYRRGAVNSGDIDCLITKPGTSSSRKILSFLQKLVAKLTDIGFLVAALAVPHNADGTKWHGACVPPGTPNAIWRRIDFLLVPASELGAALIYFTGDDIFNRSLRLLACKKGWRLNQRGLYKDVMRGPGRVKLTEGTLIESENEEKIFEFLGVPWQRPEDRVLR
jgi:DNA polymerase IV